MNNGQQHTHSWKNYAQSSKSPLFNLKHQYPEVPCLSLFWQVRDVFAITNSWEMPASVTKKDPTPRTTEESVL